MDQRTYTIPTTNEAIVPLAYGFDARRLGRRLKRLNPAKRALLASDLLGPGVHLENLTKAQVAAITKVAPSYIGTVQRASDEERRQLSSGQITLSALHHRRRQMTDADVERIVKKIGPDRILRVLDRLTAPQHLEAAE